MNSTLLQIYYSLPPWSQSLVATSRGAYLRYWRYDRHTERRVQQTLEREHWSPASNGRISSRSALHICFTEPSQKFPTTGKSGVNAGRRVTVPLGNTSENWGFLEKEPIRQNPEAFVAEDCRTSRMFAERTSGTTGKPLVLWRSLDVQRAWYGLQEARFRRWNGISLRDRWGILGGQLIAPVSRRSPPFWVWNAALNQLYLSSFHLAPVSIPIISTQSKNIG